LEIGPNGSQRERWGKTAYVGCSEEEGLDMEGDEDAVEAALTIDSRESLGA